MTDEERLRRDRERKAAIAATPIGKLAMYRRVALHRSRHSRTEATRDYWEAKVFEIDLEIQRLKDRGPGPGPDSVDRSARPDIEVETALIRKEWDARMELKRRASGRLVPVRLHRLANRPGGRNS